MLPPAPLALVVLVAGPAGVVNVGVVVVGDALKFLVLFVMTCCKELRAYGLVLPYFCVCMELASRMSLAGAENARRTGPGEVGNGGKTAEVSWEIPGPEIG